MDPYVNKVIGKKYKITRKLGQGLTSNVYLAGCSYKNSELVAIKILKPKSISHRIEDTIRFHREAGIMNSLSHPKIIKLYELIEDNNLICMIMEYFKGVRLLDIIDKTSEMSIQQSVDIIHSLCEALHYIHHHNIIHRDLKPGNILIAEKNGCFDYKHLKIIDFGLSQIKELEKTDDVHELIGTYGYMAPEQTGLCAKKADERSDLYSLGIIFYQLLTKQLPFTGKTVSSLIHQHIAKKPVPPSRLNREIPQIIDSIILKLLEKEPEKRYQSAWGILKDLEKIQIGVKDFIIGLDDTCIKLNFRAKMIGREKEFHYLKGLASSSIKGQGRICLIKGEPGIGKSRLADELRHFFYTKTGIFIRAKCFPGITSIPYNLFKEVLRNYLKTFRHYTKIEKMGISKKLKESLGELGAIILKLNPEVNQIIGDFPLLVHLDPERERQRFIHVVSHFFLNLAQIEGGIIVCLDDLQWSDETSIAIITEIAKHITNYPLFIIGIYRPDEIAANKRLQCFDENIKKNPQVIKEITIDSFSREKTEDFISHILFTHHDTIQSIIDLIYHKSGGNPFFIIEILKQMTNEKIIVYKNAQWHIHAYNITKIKVSTNIIEILLKRISLLNKKDIVLLSYAALFGRKFHIDFLFQLKENLGKPGEWKNKEIVEILEKTKRLQLIEGDPQERGIYNFYHDRVQETFYKKIQKEEKKELHNKIGKTLETYNKGGSPDLIFQLAYHYIEAQNTTKILEYAYPAGLIAKENYAYEDAIHYLKIYKQSLEENGMRENKLWIACIDRLGEIYLIIGKNNEAIFLYEKILPMISEKRQKAKIYMKISQAYFKKWDRAKCEYFAQQGLGLIGENLPLRNARVWIDIIIELAKHIVHMLFPRIFIRKKKPVYYEKYRIILWFYYSLSWLYVLLDTPQFIRSTLRGLNLCVKKIGISKEYAMFLGGVGSAIMSIPFFNLSFRYLKKALQIKRRLDDNWGEGQILFFLGCYYQWKGEYLKSNKYFKQSLDIMKRIGDTKEMAFSIGSLSDNYRYMSLYRDSFAYNQDYYEIGKNTHDDYAICGSIGKKLMISFEKGDFEELKKWLRKINSYTLEEKNYLGKLDNYTYSGFVSLHEGEIEDAIAYFEKGKEIVEHHNLLKSYSCYVYSNLSRAYLILYNHLSQIKNNYDERDIRKKISRYCRLALKKTRHWVTFYCVALRVNAMYMALRNKYKKAERFFLMSIKLCKDLGRKYECGLGYYEYGIFLNKRNKNKQAKDNWEKAYRLFKDIGAMDYLKKTGELLGLDEEEDIFKRISRRLKDNQMESVLKKWTKIMHSATLQDNILDQILDLALEITGAQRGILFFKDEKHEDLNIEAAKSIDKEDIDDNTFSITLVYEAFHTGQTIISPHALSDRRFSHNESIIKSGIKFFLCLPIIYKNHIKGVCYVDNSLSSITLTKDRIDLLSSIMTMAVVSYENSILTEKHKRIKIDKHRREEICTTFGFTKRENEIMCLVLKNMTNKEICKTIYVSLSTLRTHLNHIYHKTKTNSRRELIELFIKKK